MRITAKQATTKTLADLYNALDRQQPVTITYIKADGTQTIRTIELYDIRTTKAGAVIVKAMDRETGESRTFRLDRLVSYTVHRTAYLVARPESSTPAAPVATCPATLIGRELARDGAAYYADRYTVLTAA